MKDQLCCPLCTKPFVFHESQTLTALYTECIHLSDITANIHSNNTQLSVLHFYLMSFRIRAYFDEDIIKVYSANYEFLVEFPIQESFFLSEQECIRKLKLYLTLS